MGFITRLLAGLTAAAALGAGLSGTANAVETTGTTGNTKSVVKLADDGTSNLPDHLVNGDFEYPVKSDMPANDGNFWYISQNDGSYFANGTVLGKRYKLPEGFDKAKFAWHSTQTGDTYYPDLERADDVQVDYKADGTNHYSEISAAQSGATIYQDVATVPGVMYKWSLKHASLDSSHLDKMSVIIGEPGKETAQEATRTTANGHGDKLGKVGTVISTKVSNPEMPDGNKFQEGAHTGQWETYTGTYIATGTVTRFAFHSVEGYSAWDGNLLDDISFSKAYKLTYDKNASDATGKVPSDETAGTVRQTKARSTGTVRLASDDKNGLPDHLVNGDFEYPGANVLSKNPYNWWGVSRKDKMVYYLSHETQWVPLPSTFDSDRFAWDSTEVAGVQNGSSQWHTNEVELQQDSRTGNMYAELCAYQAHTSIRQYIHTTPGTLYKVRLKHASLSRDYLDKMQVLVGPAGNEQPVRMTRVESQNGLDATGESTASTTISTHASNEMEIKDGQDGQGTPYSSRNHNGQWATYEGVYVATSDVTSFTFKSVDAKAYNLGNLLDDIVFDEAYRLSYDKNATDANGSVPSDETAGTVKPAKAKTTGTVKTVADENVRYGSLANGDFSYPSFSDIQKNEQESPADLRTFLKSDDGTLWYNMSATDLSKYGKIGQIPGFDSSRFAWSSTENGSRVELQQDRNTKNTYAEIVAQQDNTSIYQNVSTGNGGVLYKIRLKHASRQSSHVDRMQVLVGSDTDHATPVEMTRVTSNGHGDKVGGKSTIITTKVSNTDPRDHGAQWETYEGYYQVPEGQKNTVFMFKSLEGFKEDETLPGNNVGNLVDDIEFSRSYKLTYDANSSDASGQVPSDTAANTVKQAKSKTNGSVRLAADDDVAAYAASNLPKQIMNGDFDHDWRNIVGQSRMSEKYNFANVDPAHGDVEISGGLNGKGEASKHWVHLNGFDAARFGWKSNQTDTRVDGRGGIVEIQRSRANDNMYAEITASQANTYLYQDIDTAHSTPTVYTVKLRYAHRNGSIGSNEKIQILVGAPGHEQPVEMTRIASDRGNRLGEKSTTVNAPNTDGWLGSWDTFQGSVEIPAGQPVSRFTFKALGSIDGVTGNLIDDVQFKLAYPLSYDKNAGDETDGKVSDLVQRSTTHEDGSVTVKTIDTSTDVVSGCQVYYPAGQRITLATMAKDDDCWDASMLSRPGHTQLGWNQDRNATAAQPEVTMVEGGMTVYAVWVGNPVLTYDTNKPSTWSGQMPSTPASVSVPYNTNVSDESGWRAGDTTKIRGYRFLGWYTGPQDNAGLYDWTRPLTGNVTVYAHWQRLQANVIYDPNGGTGSHPNTTGWQYSDVTIPGDTSKSFKRDKYVFKGWGTKPGKADVVYKDGSKVALQDKDITLYAQWQEVHENFVETGGIGLPIAIAGGVLLLMFGIGSTVMLTRRMNGHGMPDDE